MNRRSLLASTSLAVPAAAVVACSQIQSAVTTLGGPATAAQIVKVLSYLQGGVSGLSTVVTIFGALIPPPYGTEAQVALTALTAAAQAFGQALQTGAAAGSAAGSLAGIETLFGSAASALLAGLQSLPNPNGTILQAIATVESVQAWAPTITAMVDGLLGLAAPKPVPSPAAALSIQPVRIRFTAAQLGIVIP